MKEVKSLWQTFIGSLTAPDGAGSAKRFTAFWFCILLGALHTAYIFCLIHVVFYVDKTAQTTIHDKIVPMFLWLVLIDALLLLLNEGITSTQDILTGIREIKGEYIPDQPPVTTKTTTETKVNQ